MPVESAADLAGFFDIGDFAEEGLVAYIGGAPVPFAGILTQGHLDERPGSTASITATSVRVIAARGSLPDITQGDQIQRANGEAYLVNEVQHKADVVVLHLHDVW